MRAEFLSRFYRALEKDLHADGGRARATENTRGVPARKSGCERRRDREEDLRSRPRKLRQARQDFSAAVSLDPRPGARPAPRRVHPAGHAGPRRRTARRNDRTFRLTERGATSAKYMFRALGLLAFATCIVVCSA